MRTVTKTVYRFHELSDGAKARAIDELYDINVNYEWWDFVYDEATRLGFIITGFDICRGSYCDIKFKDSASSIACKIRQEHGENCGTFKTASAFLTAWDNLVEKYSDGIEICKVTEDNEFEFDEEGDELVEEFKKDLSSDYLSILQTEYEYMTSEKAIIEAIEANEYEFDEDGNLA